MAFHHRTGAQVLLNSLTVDEQSRVLKNAVDKLKEYEGHQIKVSPYCMSDTARELLDSKGVPLSSTPYLPHSHPVCKTLENHLLFNVLPEYIVDNSFLIVSMKLNKFNLFSARTKLPFLELVNRYVTVKDCARYSKDYVVHSSEEGFVKEEKCLSMNSLIPVLKKKVEIDPGKRTRPLNIFMHDELHYWNYEELSSFLDLYKPNVLIGTHVFPKEILKGFKCSINPTVYEFAMDNDSFDYFPDGCRTESYRQRISSGDILRTRKIITSSGLCYTVSIPYTIFSHSIVIIKFGDFHTEEVRYFDQNECADLTSISRFGTNFSKETAISLDLISNLTAYLKSLKKPDVQSAVAKLRMYKNEVKGAELKFVNEFAEMLIRDQESRKMITDDWLKNSMANMVNLMPPSVRKFFKCFRSSTMADFIGGMNRVIIKVNTRIFDKDFKKNEEILEEINNEKKELRRQTLLFRNRRAQRYSLLVQEHGSQSMKLCLSPLNREQRIKKKKEGMLKNCRRDLSSIIGLSENSDTAGYDMTDSGLSTILEQNKLRRKGIAHIYLTDVTCARACGYFCKKKKKIEKAKQEYFSDLNEFVEIVDTDFLTLAIEKGQYQLYLQTKAEKKEEEGEPVLEEVVIINDDLESEFAIEEHVAEKLVIEQRIGKFSYVEFGKGDEQFIGEEAFNRINVPGDGNCLFHCVAMKSGFSVEQLKKIVKNSMSSMKLDEGQKQLLLNELNLVELPGSVSLFALSYALDIGIQVIEYEDGLMKCSRINEAPYINLFLGDSHFQVLEIKNACVIRCISQITNKACFFVMKRIYHSCRHIYHELQEGHGLDLTFLGELFESLGLHVILEYGSESIEIGSIGPITTLLIENNHMSILDKPVYAVGSHSSKQERNIFVPNDKLKGITMLNKRMLIPSEERATRLFKSFEEGYTGVIASEIFKVKRNEFNYCEHDVSFHVGTFGSGKSRSFIRFCSANQGYSILIISPRKELAVDIEKKIKLIKNSCIKICTFETALSFCPWSGNLIIIDELQLCPPGYLDLMMAISNKGTSFVVTGDPCQASYDSDKDRLIFDEVPTDFEFHLMDREFSYNAVSHRFANTIFKGRLPANLVFNQESVHEQWFYTNSVDEVNSLKTDVILVSSFGELSYYKKIFKRKRVLTFGQSTGLTVESAVIVVSRVSLNSDVKRWIVALSRCSNDLGFYFEETLDPPTLIEIMPDHILSLFLTERASVDTLFEFNLLPSHTKIVNSFKIGSDEVDRELRLSGDPWLKTMIDLAQRTYSTEEEMAESVICENFGKIHVPIEGAEVYRGKIVDEYKPKEKREFRIGHITSMQFSDQLEPRNKNLITNQAQKYESIYPRHKNSDTVTFLMAVKKRLSFSNPRKEKHKFLMHKRMGEEMADIFERFISIKAEFNTKLFLEAKNEFEVKKLEKSQATIENHAQRSSRDWKIDEALIFMKSQLCTKYEKRFTEAKAGQTLACFSHIVLVRFAPYIRYMEKILNANLPENFYIHNGKNFDELNEFVKKNDFSGTCTESDYEAFDASQDSLILAFESAIMRRMNMPREFIDDYIWLKCNLSCRLGNVAIMRFTGEAATFLFNTMANICFTIMAYNLTGKETILFAGDDMCMNVVRKAENRYIHIMKCLKLKAKVQLTKEPTFCGWRLTELGIFKRPQLILERYMIAIENGNLLNCIDNYAIECSYAYKLGDRLVSMLSEEEACAHYLLVRKIILNRHLLKCSIATLFKACDE